jgi:hypothetical protein
LTPNTGPIDGSRNASATRLPIRLSPWPRPIDTVVLPSPARVGLIAETSTIRPGGLARSRASAAGSSFAMWRP